MPRHVVEVTYRAPDPHLLPPWASMAVVLLKHLADRALLTETKERLRLSRKAGGHDALGVVVLLVVYFASRLGCGLRPFWNEMTDWTRSRRRGPSVATQLSAMVGRVAMCSPAALSRALAGVDVTTMRPHYEWLLVDVPDLLPLLAHPSVLMRDAHGDGWHAFDFDPSVKAFRERELSPGTDDRPTGQRRTAAIAAPGYSGRKRGETQYTRAIASHAGLGAWIFSRLSAGNGDARGDLAAGLDAILSLLRRMDARTDRALVRLDGAYGGVPALTALLERGLPFVTRATQHLMDMPEVQARLAGASWVVVPGAEVEGMRSVAELGRIVLEPSDGARREDGSPYEPVTVRAVVSRVPKNGDASRGVVIDGWQYEVFLTALEPDAWPAAEVVAAYHDRSTCENRYAQEDRELGLDRTFSFRPGGQELATVIGMMVWNLQIAHGFRTAPPPEDAVPPQPPRADVVDERKSTFPQPPSVPSEPASPAVEPVVPLPEAADIVAVQQELTAELGTIPWTEVLASRPGWAWDAAAGGLRCPDGQLLRLVSVGAGNRAGEKLAAYFATKAGTCRDCPVREVCLQSKSGKHHKQINVTVPTDVGQRLIALLRRLPHRRRFQSPAPARPRRPSPPRGGHVLLPMEASPRPGPWQVLHPSFLPAEARRRYRELAEGTQVEIVIDLPRQPPDTRHPLVARSSRERRHGRTTWAERHARYDLPEGTRVALTVLAHRGNATKLLGHRPMRASGRETSTSSATNLAL